MAQTKRDTPIIHTLILRVSPAVNPLEMSNEYIEEPGKCKIIFAYFMVDSSYIYVGSLIKVYVVG